MEDFFTFSTEILATAFMEFNLVRGRWFGWGIKVLGPCEASARQSVASLTGGDRGGVGGTPKSSVETVDPSDEV